MTDKSDYAIRLGIAAIAASLGKAMQQRDPEFGKAFVESLERAYGELRDSDNPQIEAMEMVKWTGNLMETL
jgi:hypothetical protein